jgi:Fe-S-cluster-containing hydrogenase component 2
MKCVKVCPKEAIEMKEGLAVIDHKKCDVCGECVIVCPKNVIHNFAEGHVAATAPEAAKAGT